MTSQMEDVDLRARSTLSDPDPEPAPQSVDDSIALIAARLRDPAEVARIADRPTNREPLFGSTMWAPSTLSHGWPGTAMFFGELSRDDPAWLPVVDEHLRCAMASLPDHGSAGLYAGPASVLAAALNVRPHYGRLRERLAEWVATDQLERLQEARRARPGVSWSDYDAINGLAGTGRLLLASVRTGGRATAVTDALNDTIDHLCRISETIDADGHRVPGWWVPQELEPVEQDREEYPRGDFNLGLAHGIAGPLALLSQVLIQSDDLAEPDRIREAVARISSWLAGWAQYDASGIYWPARVSWEDEIAHTAGGQDPSIFTRTAWCYGAPGVTAALHQAALALGDDSLRQLTLEAVEATAVRPRHDWRVAGPTMCHGIAGVLAATMTTASALGLSAVIPFQRRLAIELADSADPECAFGYSHVVPTSPFGWLHSDEATQLDCAGLLEGAAGVGCALLMARRLLNGVPEEGGDFGWQSAFLMR